MEAYDEDERKKIAEATQDLDGSSESDSGDEHEHANSDTVEWLATGRAKRSTAGNRMKSMLAAEEPDDDLELLFAEDGDDAGFTDVDGDGSDVQMDSSSDDEDAQENADEMEGERELEKQARENRQAARKRKAQEAIPLKFRKKVKIAPTTGSPAPRQNPKPRPKKKSERLSWLPTAADMPTRASQRQTTMLGKEALHQQMQEREAKRLQQLEAMERKAKRMEALKKPPMTQAERLAEAAIVERRNAKSLNRWEEAEKQREEERRAKLAALNDRTLDGPVMTFWSGMGEWVDGKLKHIGKIVTVEEKPVAKKKRLSTAVADGAGEATEVEMVAEGTETSEAAQPKDQITTTQVSEVKGEAKEAEPSNSDLHNGKTTNPANITDPDPAASTASEVRTNGHDQVPSSEATASHDCAIENPVPGSSIAENHTQQVAEPVTPHLKQETEATLTLGLQNGVPCTPNQPGTGPSLPEQPAPLALKENATQQDSTDTPPTKPLLSSEISEPEKPLVHPSPTENPANQEPGNAQPPAANLPAVEQPTVAPEADQATAMKAPQAMSLDMKGPSLEPPEPRQTPAESTYTTSMFAPPASAGFMKAPEVALSSNRFLAPPAGVSQGGLSMPVLGYQSAPPPSTSGVLAPPVTAQGQSPPSIAPVAPQPTENTNLDPKVEPNQSNPVQSPVPTAQIAPTPNRRGPKPNPPSQTKQTKGGSQRKQQQQQQQDTVVPSPPPTPPPNGKATRNCIILQNFNENAIKEKSVQNRILFGRDMNKLAKPTPAPRCVITNQPARYKDPQTGLPYYNYEAFKKIRELERGDYKWSRLVGAWLGNGSTAAQGVPARFLDPTAPAPPKPTPPAAQPTENKQTSQEEGSKAEVKQSIEPTNKAIPAEEQTPGQDLHPTKTNPSGGSPARQAALEAKSSITAPIQVPEKIVATPNQEPPTGVVTPKSVGPPADAVPQPPLATTSPTNSVQQPPTSEINDTKS